MKSMKSKIISGIAIFICAMMLCGILASCQGDKDNTPSGEDAYGRVYGQIYDIDDQPSGTYKLTYSIEDTSTMGKTMIAMYCLDYVNIIVDNGKYQLVFYCTGNMLSDVKLSDKEAKASETEDGMAYTFEIDRQMLDDKMAMSCYVTVMKKQVSFSIKAHVDNAVLVG